MIKEKSKALGRGLDALLPSARPAMGLVRGEAGAAEAQAAGEALREIPLEMIERNPYQPRSKFDEASLEELAASIKTTGVVQPILVRPLADGRVQLIAGERRWLASQRAGKKTIPALVRRVSDEQAMEITIVENLQREDLNPMEQARAYDRLSRDFGMTQEEMARRTGKDRTSIANFIRLTKLPKQVQEDLENGVLSFGHCKALMMLQSEDVLMKCVRRIEENNMSVRQTEEMIRELLAPQDRLMKARRPVDPNVREAERELERALGIRVKIKDNKGRGTITLEYATLEEFDRVVEALK